MRMLLLIKFPHEEFNDAVRDVEPWFLTFGADVEFHPVMTPDDLRGAKLDKLGMKWG